ncbi:MAG TPA: lamin tail domain-containing protein [Kiritimatiellia bacterium]|nr:lamin tail domain-containing protein [Kiritimatiellia bacterium]HSA18164.1 lamin tail domain-containing protein [Kiritimatiellia bacterium]
MTIPARFLLAFAIAWLAGSHLTPAAVLISEFMADNQTVLQDEDGDYSDWIEIHNSGPADVDLGGWHLTDDTNQPAKWTFPATNLAAGAYLRVFASEKDRTSPNLHTSFKLSADGEYLALVDSTGTNVVSQYAPFPVQHPDVSYGWQTSGSNASLWAGHAGYLIRHTPGSANTCRPGPHPLYCDDSALRADITISQSDWDTLMYDPWNETYRSITLRVRHGDIDVTVTNVGIRCRGNTSREKQPRSFNIALNAFVPGRKLFGMERLYWNSDVNDPSMARPKLLNDLGNRIGLPTSYANHVALVVIGPDWDRGNWVGGAFFDAVRNNTEPVDDVFVKSRFGSSAGNLYKCNYRQWPANLAYRGPTGSSYIGDGTTYELKHDGGGDASYDDLAEFIALIDQTPSNDFPNAIMQAFDVDGFLKRMALEVLCGNWDNYWANANNYHLFLDPLTRRWQFIPYDFDNSFSIDWYDLQWESRDLYAWGDANANGAPLMTKIMGVPEFRKRYSFYMKQFLNTVYTNALLDPAIYSTRSNLVAALPIVSGGVSNMKDRERDRYAGDWPYWTYDQFFYSYIDGQYPYNGNVPNHYGITEFIAIRRTNALNQLDLQNIAPIISDFAMDPDPPFVNDAFTISARVTDDVSLASVRLAYSFNNGPTNEVALTNRSADRWSTALPAFTTNGQLRYFLRAVDGMGQSTFHPFGGTDYALTLTITNAATALVITELNYNPYARTAAEIAAGVTDDQNLEFLELHNAGSTPIALDGYRFTVGITFTFPAFTLGAGEYAVIAYHTNSFRVRYTNASIQVIGQCSGNLSNGGEALQLLNAAGQVFKAFTYDDSGDWPGRADGKGSSLEVLDPTASYDDPFNWRSSSEYGGSPGAAGLGPDHRVVVNEVLTHTDPPLCDAIELFNTTESAIDIGGWYLTDTSARYTKYRIPDGTILAAGAYVAFNETNHFNTSGGASTNDFALDGAHGDDVYLMQADAAGNLQRFVDHPEFGAAANGESFGRWPNGSGSLYPMSSRTFGEANSGPRVGPLLVSEVMYNPPSGSNHLEFIEVYNPLSQATDMTRWQLDTGVTFQFPTGTTVGAHAALVVLPFNPAAPSNSALLADFRSVYGISTSVPLVGAFSGTLDNGGEEVRLMRPDDPPAGEPSFYPMLIEDVIDYDDDAPWPAGADGGGLSLTRGDPALWGADAASWAAATPTPGSHESSGTNYTLTIRTDHGTATLAAGAHLVSAGQTMTNSVTTPDIQGGSRYANAGWIMTGHSPESGNTNGMTMTVTNDATLTWRWTTNYMLTVSSGGGGWVTPEGGWHEPGAIVALQASPSNGYRFAQWTGDTHAITAGGVSSTSISVTVSEPVSLTAQFSADAPAAYYVSPAGSHTPPFTNWATASTGLQAAVDYVPAGATVLVAEATYSLSAQVSIAKALTLRSTNGSAATILDGGDATRCLYLAHADAVVEGFTLRRGAGGGNSGGGARIEGGGRLVNCILHSNSTEKSGGGAALINGGELRNCLAYANTAGERGGGAYTYTDSGAPVVESCTFARNAGAEAGGIYLNGSAVLLNSIAWANSASSDSNIVLFGSGQDVQYSTTGPAVAGTGNSAANPAFVDAVSDNFRLGDASPCIDAGTNQAWMAGALELDARPRVAHNRVDQGAYEAILTAWDTDGNGLPDWWEWQYEKVLTGTDPDGDPDGDHMPNRDEYPAGSHPGDGDSFLGLAAPWAGPAADSIVLSWRGVTGISYRVEQSTNLAQGFTATLFTNIPGVSPYNSRTDSVAGTATRFYRVRLEP